MYFIKNLLESTVGLLC